MRHNDDHHREEEVEKSRPGDSTGRWSTSIAANYSPFSREQELGHHAVSDNLKSLDKEDYETPSEQLMRSPTGKDQQLSICASIKCDELILYCMRAKNDQSGRMVENRSAKATSRRSCRNQCLLLNK